MTERREKYGSSEHLEQCALFEWAEWAQGQYPELALIHAIPNGGHRHKATAAKMRREGVKSGVPDICLPIARRGFHGLYIELKYGRNKPSENQYRWIESLRAQGYCVQVCYGAQIAQAVIEDYLGITATAKP
jgi:hypothetical protein